MDENLSRKVERLEERMDAMESRVTSLDDSVQEAVAAMMPKMDALLNAHSVGTNSEPSSVATSNDRSSSAAGRCDVTAADGDTQHTTNTVSAPASLLEAAKRGDAEAITRLLTAGADTQQPDEYGNTAMHFVAIHGHLPAASVLLDSGAQVDPMGQRLRTPLHYAAAHGHLQVVQRLLEAEAKVDAADANGNTPLFLAAQEGSKEAVEPPLQGVPSEDVCATGAMHAAKPEHWEIVKLLLQKGASATKCKEVKESPLVFAAKTGQACAVRHLLQRGAASYSSHVEEALNVAKTPSVLWTILEAVPKAVEGNAGVHGFASAAYEGRVETMVAFLEAGVDVNGIVHGKLTALHAAAFNGSVASVNMLLTHGARVNIVNRDGDTPLHWASQNGHVDVSRALLEAGATATVRNNVRKTPIDVAKNKTVRRVLKHVRAEEGCELCVL